MAKCLIGVGANLGDREAQLRTSIELLRQHPDIHLDAVSGFHVTPAAGGPCGQDDFLNAAVQASTSLPPRQLLGELQRIEFELGRRRGVHWGPRKIDLDLLLYDDLVSKADDLELPHPRMAFRRFVIEPACEIASGMLHPQIGWPLSRIASHLDASADYIAVTGVAGTGKTDLLRSVARRIPIIALPNEMTDNTIHASPAGRAERERNIMARRFEVLQAIPPPHRPRQNHPATYSVSDFWFDQSAAYISCGVCGDVQAELLEKVRELRTSIPRPKLLVVLTRSLPAGPASAARESLETETLACLQQHILDLSRMPGQGPTLWLNAGDPDAAAAEIAAAIVAMG